MGIGILFGLLLFSRTKPVFLKVILSGLIICLGLGLIPVFSYKTLVVVSFGLLALVFSIWCGQNDKWIGFIIGIFSILSIMWTLFDYQYWNLLQFLMIIPLSFYVWTLFKWRDYQKVLSILTVLAGFELTEFLIIIGTWI